MANVLTASSNDIWLETLGWRSSVQAHWGVLDSSLTLGRSSVILILRSFFQQKLQSQVMWQQFLGPPTYLGKLLQVSSLLSDLEFPLSSCRLLAMLGNCSTQVPVPSRQSLYGHRGWILASMSYHTMLKMVKRYDPTSSAKDCASVIFIESVAFSLTSRRASLTSAVWNLTACTLVIRLSHLVSDQDFTVVWTWSTFVWRQRIV